MDLSIRENFDPQWENYNKRTSYYSISHISEHEIYNKRKHTSVTPERPLWSARNLSVDDTMIHHFFCYLLVLIFSNHALMTNVEMYSLFSLKNNIFVNWTHVIMHHIMRNQVIFLMQRS